LGVLGLVIFYPSGQYYQMLRENKKGKKKIRDKFQAKKRKFTGYIVNTALSSISKGKKNLVCVNSKRGRGDKEENSFERRRINSYKSLLE
jgi:hypothetical protein